MADETKGNGKGKGKGEDQGTSGTAGAAGTNGGTPSAEAPQKKGNGHFAHVQIIHDGKVIPRGDELPEDFPKDSLERLKKLKHVAQVPPAEGTTITVDTGTPIEKLRDPKIERERDKPKE